VGKFPSSLYSQNALYAYLFMSFLKHDNNTKLVRSQLTGKHVNLNLNHVCCVVTEEENVQRPEQEQFLDNIVDDEVRNSVKRFLVPNNRLQIGAEIGKGLQSIHFAYVSYFDHCLCALSTRVDTAKNFIHCGMSSVIRWILPTRRPQADYFGLLSNVVFEQYLEGTPATPSNQNTCLSCSRPVRPTLCFRDMDSHFSRCQVPGGIPYEMPMQNAENLMEAVRSQLGNIRAHWPTCHQRRHPTSSHRRLWSHCQTAGNTPAQSITASRQPLTRSSSPSLLELSAWSPTWQMDRQNPKRHQPDTCRPMETARPLDAVIVDERRDGPRWLCEDDDGDIIGLATANR